MRRRGCQGRESRRRAGPGQAEQVHPARRRREERQPPAGGESQDAGRIKGYKTNLAATPDGEPVTADYVISSYHELWRIEKSFRMSKSDLQARPVYHRKRDSIEAHLTIVFAALAVSRWIEARTGWSIRKFVKTARRYREIKIQVGRQTITAADPVPDDLRQALDAINRLG